MNRTYRMRSYIMECRVPHWCDVPVSMCVQMEDVFEVTLSLLESMLLGPKRVPHFLFQRNRPTESLVIPRSTGSYPTTLDVGPDGYPSDDVLDAVRSIGWKDARRWMAEQFPSLARELPYTTVQVDGPLVDGVVSIYFATGGWSGCEDFIGAVLENLSLRQCWESSERGGAYRFTVPVGGHGG